MPLLLMLLFPCFDADFLSFRYIALRHAAEYCSHLSRLSPFAESQLMPANSSYRGLPSLSHEGHRPSSLSHTFSTGI